MGPGSYYHEGGEDFAGAPAAGFYPKWFGGVLLPAGFIVYGIYCLVTHTATLFDSQDVKPVPMRGPDALAVGAAAVSLGLFLHTHFFWGNIYHFASGAVIGKIVGLLGFISSLGYLMIHLGILGK